MTILGFAIVGLASALMLTFDRSLTPVSSVGVWRTGGPSSSSVSRVLVDPQSPQTIYAVAEAKISKSVDGGRHWMDSDSGIPFGRFVRSLALNPSRPSSLYAATTFGVFSSPDGAQTWTAGGGLGSSCVSDLAIDPKRPGTLYAITCPAAYVYNLIRSNDDGRNWSAITLPIGVVLTSAAIAPDSYGTLYLGANVGNVSGHSGILRSSDGAQSWTPIGGDLQSVRQIVIDPLTPTTLYAVTPLGVFRSEDRGDSWALRGSGEAFALAIDPKNTKTLYAGGTGGVWKSLDGGQSWHPAGSGFLSCFSVQALAIDPQSPATVYAGTDGEGLFQTTGGGAAWIRTGSGLPGLSLAGLAVDAVLPQTVYAATDARGDFGSGVVLYRSSDGGAHWLDACPAQLGFNAIAVLMADPSAPATLYAGTGRCVLGFFCVGAVLRSRDGGNSWQDLFDTTAVTALSVDPERSGVLYLGVVGRGVVNNFPTVIRQALRSADGGASWIALGRGLPEADILGFQTDPGASETVYVFVDGAGVFKSTNGGADWAASSAGLTDLSVKALEVDPNATSTIYAGTASGLFKSTDGAATWSATSLRSSVAALVFDPRDSRRIYTGTSEGVFVSSDGGGSWTPMNQGLMSLTVRALAIDQAAMFLHAANDTGVVFDLPLHRLTHSVSPRGAPASSASRQ